VRQGNATGRFYCLYNTGAAVEIGDDKVRARYEYKAARDRDEIHAKIAEISSSRSYRIVGAMQAIAESMEMDAAPALKGALGRWRRWVVRADAVMMAVVLLVAVYVAQAMADGFGPLLEAIPAYPVTSGVAAIALLAVLLGIHVLNRRWAARRIARTLPDETASGNWRAAFLRNTVFWRSIFRKSPAGLGRGAIRQLHALRDQVEAYVQRLNNQFMDDRAAPKTARAERQPMPAPEPNAAGESREESASVTEQDTRG
ncbi:MAG: dynamin family protein, partial [Thioalkalivibrio sp.]|nr:dynamin family protein [Thioalkalivibrio sp.]